MFNLKVSAATLSEDHVDPHSDSTSPPIPEMSHELVPEPDLIRYETQSLCYAPEYYAAQDITSD
jgi:hypothetical protein